MKYSLGFSNTFIRRIDDLATFHAKCVLVLKLPRKNMSDVNEENYLSIDSAIKSTPIEQIEEYIANAVQEEPPSGFSHR